jgi:hypothetical protein
MSLWWGSPLACSINTRGGARGTYTPARYHVKTHAAASSSQPNVEALTTRVGLAHARAVFHPCTCGLHGGTTTVAVALIGYHDVEVAVGMTTRRRSGMTSSSTLTCDYIGLLLQLIFHCSMRLVVMIYNLLLTSMLGWHSRNSVSVAYPFPTTSVNSIIVVVTFTIIVIITFTFTFTTMVNVVLQKWNEPLGEFKLHILFWLWHECMVAMVKH